MYKQPMYLPQRKCANELLPNILYFNCQGFLNNKDQIENFIKSKRPLILCLTETHLDCDVTVNEILLQGYKFEQVCTTNRRTGGVLIYLQEDLDYKVRKTLNVDDYLWLITPEFKISNQKFLLSNIYHPPNKSDPQFLKQFKDLFEDVADFSGQFIGLGDFNLDFSKSNFYVNKYKDLLTKNGLQQIIDQPTRVTPDSATIIDHVITNTNTLLYNVIQTPRISDHFIIEIKVKDQNRSGSKTATKFSKRRSFKSYDKELYGKLLLDYHWDNCISDTDTLANNLIDHLVLCLDSICPYKIAPIFEDVYSSRWFNEHIDEMIKLRDDKHKAFMITKDPELWNCYKRLRNDVVTEIRREKEKFFRTKIDVHRGEPRKLWKNIKTLLPGSQVNLPNRINFDGFIAVNDIDIAEKFNAFFVNSIDEIVHASSSNCINEQLKETESTPKRNVKFDKFEPLTMSTLNKIVRSMKNSGSGPEGITTEVLKDAVNVVGNRFLDVINLSLSEGKFPENWKTSIIVPVPKISNTLLCNEFRPINTVPPHEKILEIAAKNQLQKFCDENNIIVSEQSGFRVKHSCESSLLNICDKWYGEIENKKVIIVVFLDFRRAFETINRKILLRKLSEIGVGGKVLQWFESYLTDRFQQVRFNSQMSSKLSVVHGVPQGTILGPLLFIIYINDIIKHVKYCEISLFADDTMIYISGTDVEDMCSKINEDLNNIYLYLTKNSLYVNILKCKVMSINNNCNASNININFNNEKLESVTQFKYLGVILDDKLSFHYHAKYVMNKISKKLYLLKRVGQNLSLYVRIVLYKSLIAPHFDFCSSFLSILPGYRLKEFQIAQNRCMRFILKCNRYTPIRSMLDVLNFMNVNERFEYNTFIVIYKILNNLMPEYLILKVTGGHLNNNYNFRNRNRLVVNVCKSEKRFKFLFYKGISKFNSLPSHVKNASSLGQFKTLLRAFIASKNSVLID